MPALRVQISQVRRRGRTSSEDGPDPSNHTNDDFLTEKLKGWAKGKEPTERFMRKIGDVMETIGKSYILNPHKKLHKGQKKPNGQHSEVIKFTEVILDLSVIPDIFRKNRGRCKVRFLSKELNKEPAVIRALLEALAESGLLERVGEDEYRIMEADE